MVDGVGSYLVKIMRHWLDGQDKKNVRSFTWDDCIAEYNLDLEISHIFQVNEKNVKKKIFFACIGLFEERFTVWDQL